MTLQASGQISFADINVELGRTATTQIGIYQAETGVYATINTASSSRPNGTTPCSINEWYGYNHAAATSTTTTTTTTLCPSTAVSWSNTGGTSLTSNITACGYSTYPNTYYVVRQTSGVTSINDFVYTTNTCSLAVPDGWYKDLIDQTAYRVTSGKITSAYSCGV